MSVSQHQDHSQYRIAPCGDVKIESLVREVADRIVKQVHPLRIILFGSAARNDRNPESDIDLLVVMPDGTHKRQTAQMLYHQLRGLPVPVDVIVTTEGDLDREKDSPGLIYGTILQEGRDLYVT
ncbi:MAG: nucleotidyltransferase domain-containing protein [Phycisphaerales bacterium]